MNIQQARALVTGQTVFVGSLCCTVVQVQNEEIYENDRYYKLITVFNGIRKQTLKSTQVWLTPRG